LRRTPLLRKTPLRRGSALARSRPLPRESPRHRARRRVWAAATREAFRAVGGVCVPQIAPDCTGRAEQAHHVKARRFRDDSAGNCLPTCPACHEYIENHRAEAVRLGFIVQGNGLEVQC
jgi:hypothetical protein